MAGLGLDLTSGPVGIDAYCELARLDAILPPISAPPLLSSRLAPVTRSWPVAAIQPAEGGVPMNSRVTSATVKGGAERANKPSLRTRVQNLIARVRSWLDKLGSFAFVLLSKVPILGTFLTSRAARALMLCVIGFAAGVAWQSYGGAPKKGDTSSERLKAMSIALSAARQSLDKLANDLRRLEAQGLDVPQRRSAR
jgi:hypothetical protein